MMLDGHVYLNVDSQHIQQSSPRLLTATVEVPDDMINIWEVQVNKCVSGSRQAAALGRVNVRCRRHTHC